MASKSETGMEEGSWPEVDRLVRDVAERLGKKFKEQRNAVQDSVQDESRLEEDIRQMLTNAERSPAEYGISGSVLSEIRNSKEFRFNLIAGIKVLASALYPLSALIYAHGVENITCYGFDNWVVQAEGGRRMRIRKNVPFRDDQAVIEFFRRIIAMKGVSGDTTLTKGHPLVECNIGAVIRLEVGIDPVLSGETGVQASIRVPARSRIRSLAQYTEQNIMPRGAAELLTAAVAGGANILIAGGTASGKTTLLRVLCGMIEPWENLVVIEDGAELHLDQDRGDGKPWCPCVISLTTISSVLEKDGDQRMTMGDLVRGGLRFQPNRIILGESRGAEIAEIFKAMATGHKGSMTTLHAESAEYAIDQAVAYCMEDVRYSTNETLARQVVYHSLDLVVHLAQTKKGRRLTGIMGLQKGGNHRYIYEQNAAGGWERPTEYLRDLDKDLAAKLHPYLNADTIPVV